jgi:hypothetical protein
LEEVGDKQALEAHQVLEVSALVLVVVEVVPLLLTLFYTQSEAEMVEAEQAAEEPLGAVEEEQELMLAAAVVAQIARLLVEQVEQDYQLQELEQQEPREQVVVVVAVE